MAQSRSIAIIGAGLGGLSAALALIKRGFDVDVYEQAPELREVGAGLQLSASSTRILFDLGLEEQIMDVCFEPDGKEIRLWNTGQAWKLFDLGPVSIERYGFPYVTMHRGDLHKILADALRSIRPGALKLDSKCIGIDQDSGGVTIRFPNGSARADLAIGADGVHSRVRECLFGSDEPQFTGIVAWRGLIEASLLPSRLARPVGTNWMGPGGHIVNYLLRRGEIMNYVSVIERDEWTSESWSMPGTVEECLSDYTGWHEDVHTYIKNIDVPYKWGLMLRPVMSRWTDRRITLLGDACHPTLPFLAQGATMAIEDGAVLARALAAHEEDHEGGFEAYEKARVDRTSRIVAGSHANLGRFHNPLLGDPATAQGYVDGEWSPDKVTERYDWLFRYNALEVAV